MKVHMLLNVANLYVEVTCIWWYLILNISQISFWFICFFSFDFQNVLIQESESFRKNLEESLHDKVL